MTIDHGEIEELDQDDNDDDDDEVDLKSERGGQKAKEQASASHPLSDYLKKCNDYHLDLT